MTEPEVHLPVDHVEVVVGGQVLDPEGNPVEAAYAYVWVACVSEPDPGCLISTGKLTDAQGRFLITLELPLQVETPVRARAEATPPPGQGYVLGRGSIAEFGAVFQPPPVADTTFVEIVLPPNSVASRRPLRIQPVDHLAFGLLADDERAYVSTGDGVAALDPGTGEWQWVHGRYGGRVGPRYTLLGGTIVMIGERSLNAVRAIDGEVLWSRDGAPNRSLTGWAPDGLYASDGGAVIAYDVETGATRWRRELIGVGNVALAAARDLVCAEILAYIECWRPSTGDSVWSRPSEFANWLVIAGTRVISGSEIGWTARDAATGDVTWEARIGSGGSPAVSEEQAHAYGCSVSECVGVRTTDGSVVWRTAFDERPGGLTVVGGRIYFVATGEAESSLYVLDAATGVVRERLLPDPFDGPFCDTPAVGANFVFVLGCFGTLYTFERAG